MIFVYKQTFCFSPQNTKITVFKMASNNDKKMPIQEKRRNSRAERQQTGKPSKKKNEFFEKLDVFEREYVALEKERNTLMFSRRSDFRKENCGLEEVEMRSLHDRKAEKQHIKQQLAKIKSSVDKFQRELVDVKPTPTFVQKLKEMMEDVENCIMVFKDQQRKIYDDLISMEKSTLQEIKSLEKKFESWSLLPAPTTAAVSNKKAASAGTTSSMPPAVAAFEKFVVQTGGHQGGWDDYDHQLFLKLKAKHKKKEAFLSVAGSSIPGRSADEVRQHHDWFLEYMALKESKRKAILEWRQHKEAEREDIIDKNREEDDDDEEETIRKRNERLEQERIERLAKLQEYKDQKEQEKAEREEKQLREEEQKREEREKEERRRLALKAQVEEYTRRRAEEEEIMRAAEEARQEQLRLESQLSGSELARIRQRNTKLLEEKQSKIKAREEEMKEKQRRLEKLKSQVEVKAERDPSRLYKLTRGLEERRKEATTGTGSGGPLLHMPHRAVPTWRQGMS